MAGSGKAAGQRLRKPAGLRGLIYSAVGLSLSSEGWATATGVYYKRKALQKSSLHPPRSTIVLCHHCGAEVTDTNILWLFGGHLGREGSELTRRKDFYRCFAQTI